MKDNWYFNAFMQAGLVGFTLLGFLLVSLKLPQYGVLSSLVSQIFWAYAAYRAWREAQQYGIVITSFVATMIFAYGTLNYWIL